MQGRRLSVLGRMVVPCVSLLIVGLVGCGLKKTWNNAWTVARTPDRHLRLAGAQIPTEVVEGWAMRCDTVPFKVRRVGKIRFSHDGFRALVKGQANVACTSSKIPWYEAKDYLDAYGHLPRGWRVAWDAYAIYIHPDNPVRKMKTKEFKQILRREISSWSALGGPREQINLHGPHRASRGGRLFMQLAKLFLVDPHWKQHDKPGGVIEAVRSDPYALGMTVVGHADEAPYLALEGSIDSTPRVPDTDTLKADKWPILKTIWLWTPDPPDAAGKALIDYLYSQQGQAAIAATGYKPVPRDQGAAKIRLRGLPTSKPTTQP